MKYGDLISIILIGIGSIGIGYGIILNNDSSFGIVVISAATLLPIAFAIKFRMKELRSNDFFLKELKFTDTSGENKN